MEPYCEAQVGGWECGRSVERWTQQCEKHDPNRILRKAFLAGAAAQEDVEHCARLGVYHRIESYFEDFLAELKETD